MSESDVKLAAQSNQISLQQKSALDELSFIKKAQSEVWNLCYPDFSIFHYLIKMLGTVRSI